MKTLGAKAAGLLLVAAPLAFASSGAQAQAKLVTASPAADATVGVPKMVQLQFNETLDPKLSAANLTTGTDAPIPVETTTNGMTIEATPKIIMGPGTYKVLWRAVGANGGPPAKDTYQFVIR